MFQFAMAFIQFISVLVAVILIPLFIGLIVGAMKEQRELSQAAAVISERISNMPKKKGE